MAIFLRENGVLSMGNKTPVTILHETLNRKGIVANYELIYNGVGTLDPIFKYQVSALGFTAIGDGKTKKEAKHDAAAALLRKMKMDNREADLLQDQSAENVDIASPYSGSLKENYIGMLEDICMINKIPFAVFKSISEQGPPHARIFSIQCKLSTCTEVAVARTKKQAKHMAAQRMINRVKNILGDTFIPLSEKIVDYDNPEEPSNLRDIENGTFRHDMSIPLADLHNVFYIKREELRIPDEFFELSKKPSGYFDQLENPKEYLENIVRKLEGICKIIVPSKTAQKAASPKDINPATKSYIESDSELKSIADHRVEPSTNSSMEDDFERLMKQVGLTNLFDDELDQPTFEVYKPDEDDDEDFMKIIEDSFSEITMNDGDLMIYLTIVCPEGEYTFMAMAPNLETAERQAAIEALKFLRVMALPIGSANSQVAADPMEDI